MKKYATWLLLALGVSAIVKLAYLGFFWAIIPTLALNGYAIYSVNNAKRSSGHL